MADPLSDLFARAGFAGRTLQNAYKSSVQPTVEAAGTSVMGGLTTALQNLGRPAGALRAATMGSSPIEGFQRPEDFRYVNPNANLPTRMIEGAAEGILDPLNLVSAKWMSPLGKDASFGRRFAVEAAISAGTSAAVEGVDAALPQDIPGWARTGALLGTGFAAGAYGNMKANRFAPATSAVDDLLNTRPTTVLADLTTPTAYDNLSSVETARTANTHLAALDDLSPKLTEDALAGARAGTPAEVNLDFTLESSRLLSQRYETASGVTAANATRIAKEQVDNLPEMVKSKFVPTWMARIVNGQVNRNPAAAQAARVGHNYISAQQSPIALVMDEIEQFVKTEIGDVGERASLKVDAPADVRRAYLLAQEGKYGNAAVGIIAENPQHFNLTDRQRAFFTDLQDLLKYDANLSGQFGVDNSYMYKSVNEAIAEARKANNAAEVARLQAMKDAGAPHSGIPNVENYARHMTTLLDPNGAELSPEVFPRFLGAERSFQKHRLLDSWSDVMASASDRTNFTGRISGALRAAIAENDTEEIARLQELLNSGIQVGVRRSSFAESVGERLAQSARQRGEALAANMMQGGDVLAQNELKSLLNVARIPDWLSIPAKAAGAIRSMQLSADVSLFGVQIWGAKAMGTGLRGGIEGSWGDFLKTIGTEDGWARYRTVNAAKMSKWVLHDLNLNDTVLELPEDLDIMRKRWTPTRSIGGTLSAPVGGTTAAAAKVLNAPLDIKAYLDKVQFSRMATAWKLDTAEHTFGLLKAARDGHLGFKEMLTHPSLGFSRVFKTFDGQTDEQLMRAAASFSNNLFGGLNSTAQGRTAMQNLIESIFVLTPGFTRGTVSIGLQAANLYKWTPEAALARDFAVRGTLLAGMMVKGVTYALNGVDEKGHLREANVTDPSKNDWMAIPLPNGQMIRPLARWRSLGRIMGDTVDTLMTAGPIEAGQMFGEDALRWATYRQSGLVTGLLGDPVGDLARSQGPSDELGQPVLANMGNSYARDQGVLNLLFNPSGDRQTQMRDMAQNYLPVAFGAGLEAYQQGASPMEIGIALGAELLGQGQQTPSRMERQVWASGGQVALEMGMTEDTVKQLVLDGKNPIYAKNPDGTFIFTSPQRKEAVAKVAAATGLSEDIVRNNGRATATQRREILEGIKASQLDNFFTGIATADKDYADAMKAAEQAMANGMPAAQVSRFISDARAKRAAAKDSVEKLSPAAIAFLQSPDQKAKQNSVDALMSSISADVYAKDKDFFDPNTLEFNFDARDQHYAAMRQKYGASFDTWLARADAKKTPLERDRDHAFERLGTYFRVSDEIWQRTTGGALGASERDFDRQMTAELAAGGVKDPGMQAYVLSHLKQNMKPIVTAHTLTTKVRNMMRAADPQTEDDVTKWLGAQPIALKKVSRADRYLLNQLLVEAD